MKTLSLIQYFARRMGYDVVRYDPRTHSLARRKKLLESYAIEVVLDVGANKGQYAKELRTIGFRGTIISFEPLTSAYSELNAGAKNDAGWRTFNYAIGDVDGVSEIHIARNSQSSSILSMLPSHLAFAPESEYIGTERIEIKTLDAVFHSLCADEQHIFLKIDTQGFENNILRGAERSLQFIDTIQLEMSLLPLYSGESLFLELYQRLFEEDYRLVSLEPGFSDQTTGQLLQVDGIFHRFGHKSG